jgi:hypothetical protein
MLAWAQGGRCNSAVQGGTTSRDARETRPAAVAVAEYMSEERGAEAATSDEVGDVQEPNHQGVLTFGCLPACPRERDSLDVEDGDRTRAEVVFGGSKQRVIDECAVTPMATRRAQLDERAHVVDLASLGEHGARPQLREVGELVGQGNADHPDHHAGLSYSATAIA